MGLEAQAEGRVEETQKTEHGINMRAVTMWERIWVRNTRAVVCRLARSHGNYLCLEPGHYVTSARSEEGYFSGTI